MWVINNTDEIYHHGVKGMRWGVRRARGSGGTSSSSNSTKTKKSSGDGKTTSMKQRAINNVKKKVTKEKVAKAVVKGSEVAGKLLVASAADDIFYGGAGKKIAKETVKQTGRAVVTAYTMANGGYDIRWYDK